jgi:hypothetical protein
VARTFLCLRASKVIFDERIRNKNLSDYTKRAYNAGFSLLPLPHCLGVLPFFHLLRKKKNVG